MSIRYKKGFVFVYGPCIFYAVVVQMMTSNQTDLAVYP
jgi:hypothetical protein